LLSPLACAVQLARVLRLLHGVAKADERSHAAVASGAIVRSLRLGALWNVCSLPNATIALASCISIVYSDHNGSWQGLQLWLLPVSLILTKVLEAQAFAILAAAAGFTPTDFRMYCSLIACREARSIQPSPPQSPRSPTEPSTLTAR